MCFPSQIVRLFAEADNTELIDLSVSALTIFAFAYLFRWIGFSTQSFLLAIEKPAPATLISICIALVFPMVLIFALSPLGLDGIWFNIAGTNTQVAILSIAIIVKERRTLFRKDTEKRPQRDHEPLLYRQDVPVSGLLPAFLGSDLGQGEYSLRASCNISTRSGFCPMR